MEACFKVYSTSFSSIWTDTVFACLPPGHSWCHIRLWTCPTQPLFLSPSASVAPTERFTCGLASWQWVSLHSSGGRVRNMLYYLFIHLFSHCSCDCMCMAKWWCRCQLVLGPPHYVWIFSLYSLLFVCYCGGSRMKAKLGCSLTQFQNRRGEGGLAYPWFPIFSIGCECHAIVLSHSFSPTVMLLLDASLFPPLFQSSNRQSQFQYPKMAVSKQWHIFSMIELMGMYEWVCRSIFCYIVIS